MENQSFEVQLETLLVDNAPTWTELAQETRTVVASAPAPDWEEFERQRESSGVGAALNFTPED